jgi:hypothetical protein
MSNTDGLNGTFGFDLTDGHHHFLVVIPADSSIERNVIVYECLKFAEESENRVPTGALERVQFPLATWKAIAEPVKAVFNLRLKEAKRKPGKWCPGPNYLAPHYGKELVLLGWALEDVAADRADTVFRNWRGLAPEERWWLYSTANAPFSQNSDKGRGIGWRKALTVALSENPLVDQPGETGRATVTVHPVPAELKAEETPAVTSLPKKTPAKKKSPPQNVTGTPDVGITTKQAGGVQQSLFDL